MTIDTIAIEIERIFGTVVLPFVIGLGIWDRWKKRNKKEENNED